VFEKDHLEESGGRLFPSIWDGSEFNYETATDQIKEIFGEAKFPYPKPIDLIKHAVLLSNARDDIVLDSFAGSGTTGQAVLELNRSDGATRHFVLIQMPYETKEQEKNGYNICREVTSERLRRVIRGYSYKTQRKTVKIDAMEGEFSYGTVGEVLFGEYRDLGMKLPPYEELAKYIFYTETSQDFDKKALNSKTGKIGEDRKTSYYLLYTPNNKEDQALSLEWLKSIEKSEKNKNLVVYCEKIWIHRDDLAKYQKNTGRKVRPMLIPFNLK
jgi:adenine-specific DNA-methyltransferase